MTDTIENVWNEAAAPALGLTIKYGKGYEEPWLTVRGDEEQIKLAVAKFFGMDLDEIATLTAHEVVLNAKKLAINTSSAASTLGGTVISQGGGGAWTKAAQQSAPEQPAEPERSPLYARVDAVTDVDALKRLHAENPDAFNSDAELLAYWKAKGKELTAK